MWNTYLLVMVSSVQYTIKVIFFYDNILNVSKIVQIPTLKPYVLYTDMIKPVLCTIGFALRYHADPAHFIN